MAFASSLANDKDEEGIELDQVVEVEENPNNNRKEGEGADNNGTPIRYVPLSDLYTATSPCVSGSSSLIMSKKVKARKSTLLDYTHFFKPPPSKSPPPPPLMSTSVSAPSPMLASPPPSTTQDMSNPPVVYFYSRQHPKRNRHCLKKPSFLASSLVMLSSEESNGSPNTQLLVKEMGEVHEDEGDEEERLRLKKKQKRKKKKGSIGRFELSQLVIDSSSPDPHSGARMKKSRSQIVNLERESEIKKPNARNGNDSHIIKHVSLAEVQNNHNIEMVNSAAKRWVRCVPQFQFQLRLKVYAFK